eukprot:307122_1
MFEHIIHGIGNEIWIIQSQYDVEIANDLRSCFFDIRDDCIVTGPFYDFLCNEYPSLSVHLSQEFEWHLFGDKESDILHFWGLPPNESMDGPQCDYMINSEEEECCRFVPFIKRSHHKATNNVAIGMRLKHISTSKKYSIIKLQYNLLCKQLGPPPYTMHHTITFDLIKQNKNNNECIAFRIDRIKQFNHLHFQLSLRILSLEECDEW